MNFKLRKAIRTAQTAFPSLRGVNEFVRYRGRRLLRRPHEREFEVLRLFRKHESSFVDVGANQGQSIESMLIFRPDAQIVSFEANAHLADKLRRRYADRPNIRIHPTGLSDSPGEFTLFVPSYNGYVYDGLASFHREAAEGWLPDGIYGFEKSKRSIQEVRCKVETLDSFYLAPDFLKVDVQGYEYNVLLGARETLARHEPVLLIEVYDDPRIDALLRQYGYREYFLDNRRLVAGRGPDPQLNLLFLTERRIRTTGVRIHHSSVIPATSWPDCKRSGRIL